jgi:DNA-binding PadR family transcriptional regulator
MSHMTQWTVNPAIVADGMARDLNPTAASLLGFLHRGPMTGWDLARVAQQTIGDFWTVTRSQVYRELASMADRGLISAGERGSRDRQPYELTDAGREAFAAWIRRTPGPETIRFPLLLTLSFGEHVPPELLRRFVRHHRGIHAARLAQYELDAEEQRGSDDPFRAVTLAFGLAYERAVHDWFDALPEDLLDA